MRDGGAITFRRLTMADLAMLIEWRGRPHVMEWWPNEPASDIEAEYAELTAPDSTTIPYVVLREGEPVGYIQSYVAAGSGDGWWPDVTDPGVRGIDQFLAHAGHLNQGIGTTMVRGFVETLFADPEVTRVQVDPKPGNARAIRCYEKAGFRPDAVIDTPDGKALLMHQDRGGMTTRRHSVPFDPEYFARRAAAGETCTPLDAFRHAFATRHWEGAESPSGPGSSLDQTTAIRRKLPALLSRLGVQRLLDLPCGDFHWMSTVDLGDVTYIGGDLLPELIEANERQHHAPHRAFRVLDLLRPDLPIVDLVLCRDCLVHLSFTHIERAVQNIRSSGASWLLTTTFPAQGVNEDITTGDWRPLDLTAAPFHWPVPDELIVEECTEGNGAFADKSLGLWRVAQLPGV